MTGSLSAVCAFACRFDHRLRGASFARRLKSDVRQNTKADATTKSASGEIPNVSEYQNATGTIEPHTARSAGSSPQVSIDYGVVTIVDEVKEDDNVGSGALVGGLMGAVVGRRKPGLNPGVVAGAAAGAAVDAADKDSHWRYTVKLHDGEVIAVDTEQDVIYEGQCVSVERGSAANIRPVSSVHCEEQTTTPPVHHSDMADQCDLAKQELLAAEGDEAIDAAIKKVRVLCED